MRLLIIFFSLILLSCNTSKQIEFDNCNKQIRYVQYGNRVLGIINKCPIADSVHYAGSYWLIEFDTLQDRVVAVPAYYYLKNFTHKQKEDWIRDNGYDTINVSLQKYQGRWWGFFGTTDSTHIIIRKK